MIMSEASYFRGYARVPLDALYFDHKIAKQKHRATSSKNVKRLLGLYRSLGCEKGSYENAVKARISEESLGEALEELGRVDLPRDPGQPGAELPLLNVARIHCLHGLHRILAAKKYLKEDEERWWVVQLYKQDLPQDLAIQIMGDYAHEQKESDGEIFRRIRLCSPDTAESNRWWTKLSSTKTKELKQVLQIPGFATAFDAIREIEGLWAKFELGTFHRWLGSGCDEEILCALHNLASVWNEQVFGGVDEQLKSYADAETVDELEGLAPASSDDDLNALRGLMHSKKLFPRLCDPVKRERLLENLSRQRFMIPTLHSISESVKQLEPACNTMKRLCGGKPQCTIRQNLFSIYSAKPDSPIEVGDNHLFTGRWRSADAQKYFLYLQLWSICIRDSLYLGPFTPLKERGHDKPEIRRANPALEHRFGDLAVRSGFATTVAMSWKQRDPQRALAEHFREDIQIGLGDANDTILTKLTLAMKTARAKPAAAHEVDFYSDQTFDKERRNGRPYDNDYHNDRKTFFLLQFLQNFRADRPKPYITSSFARFNLLYTFFLSSTSSWDDLLPVDLAQVLSGNGNQMGDSDMDLDANQMDLDVNQMDSLLSIARPDRDITESLRRENQELSAALSASQSELTEQRYQVQHLRNDIATLNSDAESRASEQSVIQELSAALSASQSELTEQRYQVQRLRNDIATLNSDAESRASEQSVIQELIERASNLSAELTKSTESGDQLRNELEIEQRLVQELRSQTSKLGEQELQLRVDLEAASAFDGYHEEWRLLAEAKQQALEQENFILGSDIGEARQQRDECINELSDLKRNLIETENSAKTKLDHLQDQNNRLGPGIVSLAQKLGASDLTADSGLLLLWIGAQIDHTLNNRQELENRLMKLDNDAQQRLQAFTTLLQASTATRSLARGDFDGTFFYIHFRISASEYLTYHFERSQLQPVMTALCSIMNLPSSKSAKDFRIRIFTNTLSAITCTTVEYLLEASTKTRAFWIGNRRPALIYNATESKSSLGPRKRLRDSP